MPATDGDAPWRLSACEALAALRNRTLGATELVRAVAERAAALQPALNAFTAASVAHLDQALEDARAAEQRYRQHRNRPLEGLPVAIKDDTDVAGQTTSHGSRLFANAIAVRDAPLVERLRDAGAIVLGRTTASEFSCAAVTHTPAHGITRNPWNPALSPGGSSGGAGSALASGAALLATGTDMAGSLRIPAAACGVVGFKASHGRVPVHSARSLDPLFHAGPMARTVADCRLLYNVLTGPHPLDQSGLRPRRLLPDTVDASIRGWRIGVSTTLGLGAVDPEIADNLEQTARRLERLGAVVEHADPDWTPSLLDAAHTLIAWMHGARIRRHLPTHRRALSVYARAFAERSRRVTAAQRLHAMEQIAPAAAALERVLRRQRLLVCPTLVIPSIAADFDPVRGRLQTAGRDLDPALGWTLAWPFNLLAAHPVLAVPAGFTAEGSPLGIQLIGRRHADNDVFIAATALERDRGGDTFHFPGDAPACA